MSLKERTSASFGFEWAKFSDIYKEYEDNFLSYIYPLTRGFFKDKVVLDAGCGAGRHAYFAAKWGAEEVTAIDVSSKACEAAKYNCANLMVDVRCADIYDAAWRWPKSFDITLCIGVLHHLTDPYAGFVELVKTVKSGGTIAIWVYGRKDNRLALFVYEPIRRVTTHISHRVLYWLSLPVALVVEMCNQAMLPVFGYYRRFPFRTKWNDSFDVFSAPSAKYYDLQEIHKWFEDAGLRDIQVSYRMLEGKAKGIKGLGVKP